MSLQFNTGPYYDDFDPAKNFYRVLFKPGYAVQARELNQLQSILQHQISAVGNHVFKKNSVVIPGGVSLITSASIISVSGISDLSTLVGKTITNAASFDVNDDTTLDGYITAVVLAHQSATDTTPGALYVKYLKTQTDGRATFNLSEALTTVDTDLVQFNVDSTVGPTIGKVATISKGTFYTKEVFVDTEQQSIILDVKNDVVTNCVVGLKITESIVTSDDEQTLLDNAAGTPNQYAPGADRYKIGLAIQKLTLDAAIDEDVFIKMMVIENNVTTFINNTTSYAELMKMLARRTYDANGNFIVRGLDTSITQAGDDNYVYANVTGGKCYLGGYEYDQLATTSIALDKPRSSAYQKQIGPVITYTSGMTYFYVAGGSYLKEIPVENSLIQFLNAAPGTSNVSVIGYGIYKDMQYFSGTTGSTDIYKMYFDYINLEKGYTLDDIGGIKVITTATQGAPVLHEYRLSNVTGAFTAGNTMANTVTSTQTGLMYRVVNNYAYVIKNTLNSVPIGGSITVRDTTTNSTASVSSHFVTNYSSSKYPIIQIDTDTIKTLYNDTNTNTTSYSVIRRDVFVVSAAGTLSATLTGSDTFEEYSSADYFAYIVTSGSEQFVDLTNLVSITAGGQRYEITINAGSPLIGKTLWVYSTVNKVNVAEANKVRTTVTSGWVIPTPSTSWLALGHQDVVKVTKIVDGKTVGVSGASWTSNVATITVPSGHGISVGNSVVVRGIASTNNTTAAFNSGYNGTFTVTGITGTTFTYALTSAPGTFTSSSSTDAVVALPPDINSDVDITSRFVLETGNTPYMTATGLIRLIKGATPPQGQIAVQYIYNNVDAGNYISVDSYGEYTDTDLTYIGEIPAIISTDGTVVDLKSYLDFRTRPSSYFFKNLGTIASGSAVLKLRDLNISAHAATLVGKYVVGPSHINGVTISSVSYDPTTGDSSIVLSSTAAANFTGMYYIGMNTSSLSLVDTSAGAKSYSYPKDGTRFSYQYVKFTPRHLMVYVDRKNDLLKVDYTEVSGREAMYKLARNEYKLPLAYIYMKPYTVAVRDVTIEKFENPVYQMLDIHNLSRKVDRAEYYALLASNRDIESEIRLAGAENLTTSSRGLWSETFADVSNQDYFNDDFACTIYDKSFVAPGTVTRTIPLEVQTGLYSSTWKQTGSAVTLPYSEVRAFGNTNASRSNNLNPFNVVDWSGKLVLNPSVDNWVDVTSTPSSTVNNTATVNVTTSMSTTVTIPVPPPVIVPPPPASTMPPPVVPQQPVIEIVTEINNLRTSWGKDSAGGYHAITFDWVTNLGRRGRVNTDMHLSKAVSDRGVAGYNGIVARSMINRLYSDNDVREYLNAGTHFDQRPPDKW